MSKNKQEKDSKENDSKYNQELAIKDTYLHTKSLDFSLPSQGQEQNIEANKCNYYTNRGGDGSIKYIVQTYSVGTLKSTLGMIAIGKIVAKYCLERSGGIELFYIVLHYLNTQY